MEQWERWSNGKVHEQWREAEVEKQWWWTVYHADSKLGWLGGVQHPKASTSFTHPSSYTAPELLMSLIHDDTPGCVDVSGACGCLWSDCHLRPWWYLWVVLLLKVSSLWTGGPCWFLWSLLPPEATLVSMVYAAVCDHVDVTGPFTSKYKWMLLA